MYQESYKKLHRPKYNFLKVTIEDKVHMLQQQQTLPKDYWLREKEHLIKMIEEHIQEFKKLIRVRMEEVDNKTNVFIEHIEVVQCSDLQDFKTQWVYKMSYISHDFDELNEWRIMLNIVKNAKYRGIDNENEI